jgi:transcriptional regulator with XRE-family HTH domain
VHLAREALGARLRGLRRDAGLTGRQLALLAGWQGSKISKIEYGKQAPSESDIRLWCQHSRAQDHVDDLVAAVRDIEAMYVEWRRRLRTGTRRRQEKSRALEAESSLLRWYEPVLVPGLLQTAAYATAVMRRVIDFYQVPDDLEAGVAARMERQQILYDGRRRFHFVLAEQALWTVVGGRNVMAEQLDRLRTVVSLASVSLGVLPRQSPYRVPSNQFIIFDDRMVQVEAVSAELTIAQPFEVALYARAFQELSKAAVHGRRAYEMISQSLRELRPMA